MPSVCFCFEVHQPYRLRPYSFFDLGARNDYEDEQHNRDVMRKVAEKCYLPMNALLLDLIERHQGRFRVSFSLTGIVIDQFMKYTPEVLNSFRALARTGCVEFLDETDNHSLACLFSEDEFRSQIALHRERMQELFGQSPRAFRNTELVYNNEVARIARDMGYSAILAEGTENALGWRSPHYLYHPAGCPDMKLMLRSYSLSDDIAFRFSDREWPAYPLMAETFAGWLKNVKGNGDVINLFMDYETFGEHQWAETGIFDFMRSLPDQVLSDPDLDFLTVSEAADRYPARDFLDVPGYISWADADRGLSAWLGNDMQKDAFRALYECLGLVKYVNDPALNEDWRRLQTSDHLYYMGTAQAADGDVHKYFSPYRSPLEAYTNYMNILADFRIRLFAKANQ